MLLALGRDAYAAPLEASLAQADGVRMHIVRADEGAHRHRLHLRLRRQRKRITVAPGANLKLRPQHLAALSGCSHLLMQLETPVDTVLAYARAAHQACAKGGAERRPGPAAAGRAAGPWWTCWWSTRAS